LGLNSGNSDCYKYLGIGYDCMPIVGRYSGILKDSKKTNFEKDEKKYLKSRGTVYGSVNFYDEYLYGDFVEKSKNWIFLFLPFYAMPSFSHLIV
jgi:hypothetical protein